MLRLKAADKTEDDLREGVRVATVATPTGLFDFTVARILTLSY